MFGMNEWWDSLDSADRFMFLRIVFWSWLLFSVAAFLLAASGRDRALFIFLLNPLAALLLGKVAFSIISTLASAAVHGVAGSGGDPYEVGYSAQDAMVVRGEWQQAVKSYHDILKRDPANQKVRLRLARLLWRNGGGASQVEAHYLKVRESDASGSHEEEVSNGLTDLYRAGGRQEALRQELARSAQRHAGTPRGEGARRALREMMQQENSTASE